MALYRKRPVIVEISEPLAGPCTVMTLEGPLHASTGDRIVTGIKNESYPIKPDVFAETYQPVTALTPAQWRELVARGVAMPDGTRLVGDDAEISDYPAVTGIISYDGTLSETQHAALRSYWSEMLSEAERAYNADVQVLPIAGSNRLAVEGR